MNAKPSTRARFMGSAAATVLVVTALLVTPMLFAAPQSAAGPGTYQLDPAHTSFYFRIKHLNTSLVYGRFNDFGGGFTLGSEPTFEFTVQTASVDTAVEKRDDHLRSPDFFNAKQYPTITFKSTEVTRTENGYDVTGDLTLHGETNTITVPLRQVGAGEDPWGNYRVGYATEFKIKRSDYGMKNMLDAVGDEAELLISFEAVRQ